MRGLLRFCALLFGLVLMILGLAGFLSTDQLLWKVFKVNLWLNTFHFLTGLLAWIVAWMNLRAILLYFQVMGILYGLLGVTGFVYGEQNILGFLASNPANTWLHMIAATNALILGYGAQDNERN